MHIPPEPARHMEQTAPNSLTGCQADSGTQEILSRPTPSTPSAPKVDVALNHQVIQSSALVIGEDG